MSATKTVAPPHAGATPTPVGHFFSYHSALDESGLTNFIPKASILLVAQDWFLCELLLHFRVDREMVPGGVEDLF